MISAAIIPQLFSPYVFIDFYVLNSNFIVVTSTNLQFFVIYHQKLMFFTCKLDVI